MAAVANGASGAGDDDEDDEDYDPEEDDDDDGDAWYYPGVSSRRTWVPPVTTEPQEAGVKLLNSGEFGYVGPKHRARPNHANVAKAILSAASKPSSSFTPKEELTTVRHA